MSRLSGTREWIWRAAYSCSLSSPVGTRGWSHVAGDGRIATRGSGRCQVPKKVSLLDHGTLLYTLENGSCRRRRDSEGMQLLHRLNNPPAILGRS